MTAEPIRHTHEAARCAYAAGLCVLPPVEDGSKRPQSVDGTWEQFKRERPSDALMRGWYPGRSGLGIVAGAVSGHVEALDFDDRKTYFAYVEAAHAADLGAIVAQIEEGYCDDTASGGVRWLWRCPGVARTHNQKLACRPKQPNEQQHQHDTVKVLIELPDYAIVAPSNGQVHPSGRPYVRRSGNFDHIATISPEERQALVDLARTFDGMPKAAPREPRAARQPADGLRPGDDFTAHTTWAEVLIGWTPVYTRGETTYWRRPGKAFGSSATTNHGGSDLLYVFSSSTLFEPDTSYSRFGAYAVLEHGGDFSAAARALAARGYGAPATAELADGHPTPSTNSPVDAPVRLDDFYAYMPSHQYLFVPSRELWPAASVNARVAPVEIVDCDGSPVLNDDGRPKRVKASAWLDHHRTVEQMIWAPGLPMVIPDRLISDGGWIEHLGCTTFNLYRPPRLTLGDARQAGRWLEHVACLYPCDMDQIVAWLAHRVQRPGEKINHALVLGGLQGIGKDTLLEPVKPAIGPWNFTEVSPGHLLGRFNGFVKSVILLVSEARDLGEVDRFSFYDHLKIYTAAPPDVLRVDEKNLREYVVFNVCGLVITTNHKTDGLHLPADDRRHYVTWSDRTKDDAVFGNGYWNRLYRWYSTGGPAHVAAYLHEYDLSTFDPKAPPPKTSAFWDIVDANRAPEDAELADALDNLGNPSATTLAELAARSTWAFAEWLRDRKNARQVPHRMEVAGYVPVRNPDAKDGLWRIENRRQVVYARHDLSMHDRLATARSLGGASGAKGDR
jgi:hypothetical protein